MRYLLLADIHANLEALEATLEHARGQGGYDEVWCLGDIVGYGPDPGECLRRLRALPYKAVAGNHDLAAIGKLSVDEFNPEAAEAALWTAQQLTREEADHLASLPQRLDLRDAVLVHGSPREPVWEYITTESQALANYPAFEGRLCLVGHSHVPLVFSFAADTGSRWSSLMPPELKLEAGVRYIVNPGGVGQPRDGDPAASYAIYDSQAATIHHYRVPYPIAATQAKMLRAGLPRSLIARLSYGR